MRKLIARIRLQVVALMGRDATSAFQALIDVHAPGEVVQMWPGTFKITRTLYGRNNLVRPLPGRATVLDVCYRFSGLFSK